ncbi:MAG: phosphotransferase [Phycisphaerales bacterium]|nr:phosphotransferase [Phycisphaerales bacterium]
MQSSTSISSSAATTGDSVAGSAGVSGGGSAGSAPSAASAERVRERFSAEELAVVLSHFDIGIIESVTEYPRGSRKAPKLLITSQQGQFLLKRRARGKDDPFKVAFAHALQLHLAQRQFPLPHLIGTRRENNSMLQLPSGVYELFEYIAGQPYPQTLESTFDSGRVLALYHKLLLDFQSQWTPPSGSYHAAPAVDQGLRTIQQQMRNNAQINPVLEFLHQSYSHAVDQVETQGLRQWPRQIVHADWHAGNMLFRGNHVVAVIDYDAARLLPRVLDIANGALQFSIVGGNEDVGKWPEYIDESRFKRFLRGYDGVMLLSQAEVRTLPWLMIEALIAEAVFPIAATGNFGRLAGQAFLLMVQRKVHWLQRTSDHLIELAEG